MPTRGEAFDFLLNDGPAVFGRSVGSMLYVGHRSDTHPWWWQTFAPAVGISRLAVIDIEPSNLQSANAITKELYHGDIRTFAAASGFGMVFWDEGPEHMEKAMSLETLKWLAGRNEHVLISCPWGYQAQGSGPSDPEFHHWAPMPADFEEIGFVTRTFGQMFPDGHGNLLAWT